MKLIVYYNTLMPTDIKTEKEGLKMDVSSKPEETTAQGGWILITEAVNEIEADVIQSILESEGIPSLKKYNESSGYLKIYMGMTNFGVEIYVPDELKEKAQAILNADHDQEYLWPTD